MDTADMAVVAAAAILIASTLWYFFGPKQRALAAAVAGGVQEVNITVKGGYAPDVVMVQQRRPVRLNFYRDETASCSEQVVLRDFGIARDLPAFQTTPVEFTPQEPGEFVFTCGMAMMRGRIVVEEGPGTPSDAQRHEASPPV